MKNTIKREQSQACLSFAEREYFARSIYVGCILVLALFVQSCEKMNDLHQPYLDEGEIIYAAKVDSVGPGAGKERIQLEMFIRSQRIEAVRVFWNDYSDSVDVQVGNQTGILKTLIENMAERSYIFQLVSFDKYGNRSLPLEATGNVYGENFQSMLSNRLIESVSTSSDGAVTIEWSGQLDYGISCIVVYTNVDGELITVEVLMSETSTVIPDFASDLKYKTAFLPEPTAIDTFYTDFEIVEF